VDELKAKLSEANEKLLDKLSKENDISQKLVSANEQLRTKEEEVKQLKERQFSPCNAKS